MTMKFSEIPEFSKEFRRLSKKYRSLTDDLNEFKKIITYNPLGNGKHFNVITQQEDIVIIKARLFCRYLKGSSCLRIIYAHNKQKNLLEFIQIYFKGDQENADENRLKSYLEKLLSIE